MDPVGSYTRIPETRITTLAAAAPPVITSVSAAGAAVTSDGGGQALPSPAAAGPIAVDVVTSSGDEQPGAKATKAQHMAAKQAAKIARREAKKKEHAGKGGKKGDHDAKAGKHAKAKKDHAQKDGGKTAKNVVKNPKKEHPAKSKAPKQTKTKKTKKSKKSD